MQGFILCAILRDVLDTLRVNYLFIFVTLRNRATSESMRTLTISCLLTFFSLVLASAAIGQENRFTAEADNAYDNEAYYKAIELYKKAYAKESDIEEKARLIFMIGESYRKSLDLEQQIVWYKKALKARHDNPKTYFYMAEAYRQLGNFSEAKINYEKYLEEVGNDPEASQALNEIDKVEEWLDDPTRYEVDNEVLLNTEEYDFGPSWGNKEYSALYFTSSRKGAEGTEVDQRTGENFQDIFRTFRDNNDKWSEPTRIGDRINSPHNEGSPVFNDDFDVMYFTRCESSEDKNLGCDIYRVRKVGDKWADPEKLPLKPEPEEKDIIYTVGHPTLGPDEEYLIFAGDIPGSTGGKDLFMVSYDKSADEWGEPENLGPSINTRHDEMFPFLRADGSLYFSSDGHLGMGGLDIFRAESTGEKQWGNVENARPPINSVNHDFGIIFEGDEDRGFFSSNRPGGKGADDIYNFRMPPLVFALEGIVYDKEARTPVSEATVTVVGSDGSSYEKQTDESGAFRFEKSGGERYIKPETTYSIEVSKPDYLVAKDQISTVGLEESTTFVKEYFITFTAPDIAIEFPEVRYAYNKAELQVNNEVNSKDSLDYLYQTLKDNPTIIIELQAHTDTRGSKSYNRDLSQRRAESCVEYLISKGIPEERMVPKGYGESRPRISDAQIAKMNTQEEKEAAHQKNRRTEFSVLSFDYVPKDRVEDKEN